MKTTINLTTYVFGIIFYFLFFSIVCAQVGIGTTSPNGILDLNSSIYGLVLPRVELTKSNIQAPVLNPDGGSLAIGTVVYNINSTFSGSDDVTRGIYIWDGLDWINEFPLKHATIFKQTSYIRTKSNEGYKNVTGLVSQSFTTKYTGIYKIEISVNFGGGHVQNLTSGTDVLAQKGNFKFTFDGTDTIFPLSAWSVYGSTQYYLIWEQASIVVYKTLLAGTLYNFTLSFDQFDSPKFVSNGNGGNGRGYIGFDIPCSVEFIYLD